MPVTMPTASARLLSNQLTTARVAGTVVPPPKNPTKKHGTK